jgi:hypothetical protein
MNDNVTLSLRQIAGAWRLMCAAGPRSVAATTDGVQYMFSGLPIAFFNLALLPGSALSANELRTRGHEACAWAKAQSVPWLLLVTNEGLGAGVDARAALAPWGLVPLMSVTGMRATAVALAADVRGLQLTVPQDDADCAAIIDINALAYGVDLDASKASVGSHAFWKHQFPVVGVANGTPVTCAAVLMVEGHRYVALVATDPSHQHRGFAAAATRQALDNAANTCGALPTILHASDTGLPIYERMGYSRISTHTFFTEQRFLETH